VYGAEAEVVGRQIFLNGNDFTVVGIMPAGLADLSVSYLGTQAEVWTNGLGPRATTRTDHAYVAIARLRPGVSLSQAQTEMDSIAENIERAYPENKGWGVGVVTLHDDVVRNARPPLLVLLVAALFVVLVTCINLASLLLARGAMRQPELAIRAAVGAGRGRLITQLLVESLLLAMVGGTFGLALAQWGVHVLTSAGPANTPGLVSAGLNLQVLAYSAAVAVAGGLIFGCIPAVTLSKDVQQALKGGGRTASGEVGGYRVRGVFVACEFALALMLVIGASLMIRTLVLMGRVNLGFDPDRVVTMRVPLRGPQYRDPARQAQFFQQLLGQVEALPGVESASVSRGLPVVGWAGMDFVTEDRPQPPLGEAPDANYVVVGPHYFQTMKIPLVQGRAFADSDAQDRLPVVIVNEALVREQWPGQNALGKKLRMGLTGRSPWLTVVGVASNVFSQFPETRARPELYVPYTQYPWALAPRHLIVRTRTTEANVSPAVARFVADLDKDQPVADVRSMQDVAAVPMAQRRFLMQLLVVFAALALTLASLGVYGLISYAVAQRTREIGIRLALGAARLDVLRVVMSREMTVVATGLCVGLAGALALTRFLAKLLYQIAPTDPWTFAIVPLTLLGVAAMATYLPARHATEIDPLAALRHE
jgi:putative ABC transport system permease protein